MKFRRNKHKGIKWINTRHGVKNYLVRVFGYRAVLSGITMSSYAQIRAIRSADMSPLEKKIHLANATIEGWQALANVSKELNMKFNLDYRPDKYKSA